MKPISIANERGFKLSEFINLRTISNIYLFNKSGEIYLNFKDQENKNFLLPSNEIFEIILNEFCKLIQHY